MAPRIPLIQRNPHQRDQQAQRQPQPRQRSQNARQPQPQQPQQPTPALPSGLEPNMVNQNMVHQNIQQQNASRALQPTRVGIMRDMRQFRENNPGEALPQALEQRRRDYFQAQAQGQNMPQFRQQQMGLQGQQNQLDMQRANISHQQAQTSLLPQQLQFERDAAVLPAQLESQAMMRQAQADENVAATEAEPSLRALELGADNVGAQPGQFVPPGFTANPFPPALEQPQPMTVPQGGAVWVPDQGMIPNPNQGATANAALNALNEGGGVAQAAPSPQESPVITTQQQFDQLPSGSTYREEPGGPVFRKP